LPRTRAAEPDPWLGLTHFLERSLELLAHNRAMLEVLKRAYGAEQFTELIQRTTVAIERLLPRAREARVVRADVAPIMASDDPLPGEPPSQEQLHRGRGDQS
jgi:hypothetical protein